MPGHATPTRPTREAISPRRQRVRLVAASAAVALPAALLVAMAPAAHAATAPFGPGTVFIVDWPTNRVVEVPAGGGAETTVGTGLNDPRGVAVDAAGDVFIADTGNNRVVEVPAGGGAQSTVGTGLYGPYGVAVDTAGDVFIADTLNDRVVKVPVGGGAETTVGTGLYDPTGVAVDAAGDVFIADYGDNRVVEVPAGGGAQATVGTGLSDPWGLAVDAPPPVFTADTPPVTATVGTAYSYTYTASTPTAEPAATFALGSGSLPPGLTLNTATGVLSGTPTTAGTYTFTVQTQNAAQASIGPSTTITVAPGDTTPPVSTVQATHGSIPRGLPVVTVTGQATFENTSGVTAGTLKHVQCWDSHGVKLTLNATDAGSGVAGLSYSATGAQPIASTTASTLPVKLTVSTNGLSTVDYHATDNAGNVEPAQQQSVLVAGGLSCTAPTPTFTIPRHGTATVSGTVTISGFRFPFHRTIRY